MIKSKKQMFTVIGAFVLVMLLTTVTYAFFNYTRTGVSNTIKTGRISFNTTQEGTLNLTNVFPVASSEVGNNDQIEIRIQGDTTYADGEEFEISLVSVNNSIASGSTEKIVPISYIASYTATPVATGETPNNIGTSSNNYFNDRGSTTAVYKLNTTGRVSEREKVLIGYIPKDIAIDGTLTIKAYIDRNTIAISDTYDETSPETDNMGTTTEWVAGRTVLTTSEWNSLQNTPISFKVRAESNEGIWVGKIDTCPGCKFLYTTDEMFTPWKSSFYNNKPVTVLTDGLSDSYLDVVSTSGKDYFLGVKLNESNQIEKAYACGLYNGTIPFCIEGNVDSKYEKNQAILQSEYLWNNTCSVDRYDVGTDYEYEETYCTQPSPDSVGASTIDDGYASVGVHGIGRCVADVYGRATCNDGEY